MNECDENLLQEYLRNYEWTYQPTGNGVILTGWQGRNGHFPLEITIRDTWIQFRIAPLMDLQFKGRPYIELVRFIFELNLSIRLVRIAMDSKGQIELNLDVFRTNFSFELFSKTVGILGYYADTIYDEIVLRYCELSKPKRRAQLC